jgi:hypothetical protein
LETRGVLACFRLTYIFSYQFLEKPKVGGAPSNLGRFISQDLLDGPLVPIEYEDRKRILKGYEATLLPIVCDIWLKARAKGLLKPGQLDKALKAEILMRGLAHVGIIALVDEATGYQYDRARQALEEILDKFISKELRKWAKTFPDDFYQQMFRLKGWSYVPWQKISKNSERSEHGAG